MITVNSRMQCCCKVAPMHSIMLSVLILSIAVQLVAAVMAIRLIRLSGAVAAWLLLACGFAVQGVRRAITLDHYLAGRLKGDLTVELLGLVISILMATGIWKFRALFEEKYRTHKDLVDYQLKLMEVNRNLEEEATERKRFEKKLVESEKLFRTVADFTSDWEFWINPDETLRYVSKSCERMTGYTDREFCSDPGLMTRIIHPDDVALYNGHRSVLGHNGLPEPIDYRINTRDGEVRWIGHRCRQVYDDDGTLLGWRASNRDITDRKLLEEQMRDLNSELEGRVRWRTAELERLNRELESFCYSISHELRAPIARLEGFSRTIKEHVIQEDPSALAYCSDRIEAASRRLRAVIDSLLMMNRLSRTDMVLIPVNLSEMSHQIMDELLEGVGPSTVKVNIAPDIIAQGDRYMLEICMRNLLNNAVKYTSKTIEADIEFGQTRQSGEIVYFVRDNGAGFDMSFANKLFQPFCRLHKEDEFGGSGIGLAVVQRIIERHGGKIWAEAAPDRGATFFFTLASDGG